jgi:hypothetical protein
VKKGAVLVRSSADSRFAPRVCGCLLVSIAVMALWSATAQPAAAAAWDTGACNSLLPGTSGAVSPPGVTSETWVPLQQQAIAQTEELYGQTSGTDPSTLTALVKARGVTRAFMFADLVKAIKDIQDGTATTDQQAEVASFKRVVQYGRQWMALDALNLWNAYNASGAAWSTTSNSILQLIFGAIGLPWRNEIHVPTAEELLSQAETDFWGAPMTTTDGAGHVLPNYPLGGAESAQALQQATDATSFLNAIGQTQVETPSQTGTDSALGGALKTMETALGTTSSGEVAEGLLGVRELATIAGFGENEFEPTGSFIALANLVFTAVSAGDTTQTLNTDLLNATNDDVDIVAALGDPTMFTELFNDFVAQTLHTVPNAVATGNDPDCRTSNKPANAAPPAPDATFRVSHFNSGSQSTPDYQYTTQTLGGNAAAGPAVPNGVTAINDPSVIDWSYARDVGPGAPRVYGQAASQPCTPPTAAADHNPTCGGQWPISQVSYGVPGDAGEGFGLRNPSVYYPASGHWYLTFNGANGQPHTTAPVTVSSDGKTVHPTDSEVEQAIANADPQDFPTLPCGTDPQDLAVPSADRGQAPCFAWNPNTHFGTDVIVSGNQADGNTNAPPDYQVIFDIMVKGDLGNWAPQFVAHGGQGPGQPSDCQVVNGDSTGGVCVSTLFFGFPFAGDVVQSETIWPQQRNDVCVNDSRTCTETASYGWPTPYPVQRECQAISPADGMFDVRVVATVNPADAAGSCAGAALDRSFTVTPSVRYRATDGSLWTAWRVPPTVGASRFLNIQDAQLLGGETAGVDGSCAPPQDKNAICLQGSGTHWTSEFHAGDTIMLQDPASPQNNDLGGLLSMTRKVERVVDDTHMELNSSVECVSGSDGNDCMMFNTEGYTSFMNPADGSVGSQNGMMTLCITDGCVQSPPAFRFNVYKLTALNPGTTCPVWDPATAAHPPAGGCYYSDSLQFQTQTAGSDGQSLWWNLSLPAFPPAPHAVQAGARNAIRAQTDPLEPWLDQPTVTQQPQSVLVNPGADASFTAAASGAPTPSVQWQQSTDAGSTWVDVLGATAATLSVNATSAQNGNAYRAVFTNTQGSRTTRSGTLSVAAAPSITQQPGSLPTPAPGQTFTLTAKAGGVPQPAADWQVSLDGGLTWQDISGTQSSLSLIWPQALAATPLIRVIYANSAGSATSDPAIVGPPSDVPGIPSNTAPPSVSGTAQVGRTLSASQGSWSGNQPLSFAYQWQRCASTCSDIGPATTSSYKLTGPDSGARIRVSVQAANLAGSAAATSPQVGPVAVAPSTGGRLPTAAQIRAALLKILVPHGKAAKIGQLRVHHGYAVTFTSPSGGRLVVGWYQVPKGARLAKATRKPRPVLIAQLITTLRKAGRAKLKITLTRAGLRALAHARTMKLTGTGTFTPTGGRATSVRKTFTLKR